jgi:hypothetical protein
MYLCSVCRKASFNDLVCYRLCAGCGKLGFCSEGSGKGRVPEDQSEDDGPGEGVGTQWDSYESHWEDDGGLGDVGGEGGE